MTATRVAAIVFLKYKIFDRRKATMRNINGFYRISPHDKEGWAVTLPILWQPLIKRGMEVFVVCDKSGNGDFFGLSPKNAQNSEDTARNSR